jgi:release factor glutamine methyltransferase
VRDREFSGVLSDVLAVGPPDQALLLIKNCVGTPHDGAILAVEHIRVLVRCVEQLWSPFSEAPAQFSIAVDCTVSAELSALVGKLARQIPGPALDATTTQVSSSGSSRGPRVPQPEAVSDGRLGPGQKAQDDTCGVAPSVANGHFRAAMSCSHVLRDLTGSFKGAGIATPELEARWLVQGVMGITHAELISRADRLLGDHASALTDAANRRLAGEPLSRILGTQEFYGREFILSPATLDPRADTETLIDVVLKIVDAEGGRQRPLRILDLGTGTGCLLLTLLAELPRATGIGCDISREAIATATQNAQQAGVADRCELRVADMLSPNFGGMTGPFDLIVSNPPYIATAEIATLSADVRLHDPIAALDGGADGLVFYRSITRQFALLVPDGWLVLEIGYNQADAVLQLLEIACSGATWSTPTVTKDLGANQRCVAIRTRDIAAL